MYYSKGMFMLTVNLFKIRLVYPPMLVLIWHDLCMNECNTAQKMKFSIKDFFSKCDQICSFLRIWSHLLKKFLMENFIFCAV